ncbi:SIR2 family protein [Telmatospirillum sp. J64-1]|uniref:SIR2 family NAD-dependent protein deacylase n=1 Tax=Telmatospirillum sp. J64-1 TaxID=2502183 RepID=UPI00115DE71D|nr:SIR2 family protein [Telmatospirillum sp. J64-1]
MPHEAIALIAEGLTEGRLAPFLGPEVLTIGAPASVPTSTRALVERLTAKVAVPGRIRNNLWSAAQYIESNRHRQTLARLMEEIFAPEQDINLLHQTLAMLRLPLIVDSWYDSTMAQALTASGQDWGQVQAVTRNGEYEDIWYRYYDSEGRRSTEAEATGWQTLLYKPHGGMKPEGNFLLSDSDYVEVLTEIDIQTPIPAPVKDRRASLGFVFLGCRFHDQMERTFARQVLKRSAGPHYAVLPGEMTRNEARFLDEQGIQRLDLPLAGAALLIARDVAGAQLA